MDLTLTIPAKIVKVKIRMLIQKRFHIICMGDCKELLALFVHNFDLQSKLLSFHLVSFCIWEFFSHSTRSSPCDFSQYGFIKSFLLLNSWNSPGGLNSKLNVKSNIIRIIENLKKYNLSKYYVDFGIWLVKFFLITYTLWE